MFGVVSCVEPNKQHDHRVRLFVTSVARLGRSVNVSQRINQMTNKSILIRFKPVVPTGRHSQQLSMVTSSEYSLSDASHASLKSDIASHASAFSIRVINLSKSPSTRPRR